MSFARDEQQPDQNVQDPLALHRQQLRQAMEDSAALLVQSLRNQQGIDPRFEQGLAAYSQASAIREADPITADFVSKAYQQAQQMFEELEQKMNEAKSKWLSPLNRPALPGGQTDTRIEDAYAATDRMISIATSYLSEAMKAMVEAMDHRSGLKRNHEHTLR